MMMKEERFVQNISKIATAIPHRNARSQRRVMIEWKDRKIFGQWRRRENEKEKIFGEGTYFVSRQDAEPLLLPPKASFKTLFCYFKFNFPEILAGF